MDFDSCNCTLKIQESIGTPAPNMGVHLRMWGFIPSHSLALPGACNVPLEVPSWPATLQAFALVASPRLALQHQCWVWPQVGILCWHSGLASPPPRRGALWQWGALPRSRGVFWAPHGQHLLSTPIGPHGHLVPSSHPALVHQGLHYVFSQLHVWGVRQQGLYKCLPWQ
jgi:hypothetical protein